MVIADQKFFHGILNDSIELHNRVRACLINDTADLSVSTTATLVEARTSDIKASEWAENVLAKHSIPQVLISKGPTSLNQSTRPFG